MRLIKVLILLAFLPYYGFSSHIFGGYLSMVQVDKSLGKFRIGGSIYLDMNITDPNELINLQRISLNVKIFRKRDGALMNSILLPFNSFSDLIYDNPVCAINRNLSSRELRYSKEIVLNMTDYTDANGYYMAWTRCCRSPDLSNIQNPVNAGLTLYLEFPVLQENGKNVDYSSPEFHAPNGDYICINKDFSFNLSAKGVNSGDNYKYKIVTPYGSTNTQVNSSDVVRAGPYPMIRWNSGYSESAAISGNPSLTIDEATGILKVKASTIGLFAFTVQCEQFRNGVRIGLVRHDFQLPVFDCSNNRPSPAEISYNNNVVTEVNFCPGETVVLTTGTTGGNWNFQWKKNGENIAGATQPTFQISGEGSYSVTKSFKTSCEGDTTSLPVEAKSGLDLKLKASKAKICDGETAILTAIAGSGVMYEWYKDNVSLGRNDPELTINKEGLYELRGRTTGSACNGNQQVRIDLIPGPIISGLAPDYSFCQGDSVSLSVANHGNESFEWSYNNTLISNKDLNNIWAVKSGKYSVKVTDKSSKCITISPESVVSEYPGLAIEFDSIPPICGLDANTIQLKAKPAGGVFYLANAQISDFVPKNSGIGRFKIEYALPQGNCLTKKVRIVEVKKGLKLSISSKSIMANKGDVIPIVATVDESNVQFKWIPDKWLDNAQIANPKSTPLGDIQYKVIATSSDGCEAEENVSVFIGERLLIPNAFSPNNDQINDTWEITGLQAYPEAEMWIYDRWGNLVLYHKGSNLNWDGKRNGEVLTGSYVYQLKPYPKQDYIINGRVQIFN